MNSIWAWIRWAIQILENVFQFCYVNRSRIQSKSWSQCTRSSLPTTRFVFFLRNWLTWNSKFIIFHFMEYQFKSTCRKPSRHSNTGWTRSNSCYMYAITFSKSRVPIFLILINKCTTFLLRSELSCYDWNPNSRGDWSNGIHFGCCTLRCWVNSLSNPNTYFKMYAVIISLFRCWCCACIPCCIDSMKVNIFLQMSHSDTMLK